MREAITMWKYTRMVVLVALTAAMYAAALIPFKLLPIIPGITELRPANVFPVICSLMFGPAGAWGAAIGNLIGDLMGGTYGLGSYFGMVGNFFFGYIPYKIWHIISTKEPDKWSPAMLVRYLYVTLLASVSCGVIVAWGLDLLGLVPFHVLAPLISINNFITAGILGPLLLPILYQRVKQWGLLYQDIMNPVDLSTKTPLRHIGHIILLPALLGTLYFGISISLGLNEDMAKTIPLLFGFEIAVPEILLQPIGSNVGTGIIPLIMLFLIACMFL